MTEYIDIVTIPQPIAWLVIHGYMPMYNQKWYIPRQQLPGRFFVYSPTKYDGYCYSSMHGRFAMSGRPFCHLLPSHFPTGPNMDTLTEGIVGAITITDCTKYPNEEQRFSPWFDAERGQFVVSVADPLPLAFMRMEEQRYGVFSEKLDEIFEFQREHCWCCGQTFGWASDTGRRVCNCPVVGDFCQYCHKCNAHCECQCSTIKTLSEKQKGA